MTQQSRRTQALADHYVDQLSQWGKITTRPLFGAVALYRQGHVFSMVWHGDLYFKVDDESRPDYEKAGSHALGYANEGEGHGLKSYWTVPADVVEDSELLSQWAERALHAAIQSSKS